MEKKLPLQLNNISMTFPGVKALSNVTFSANQGEVLGLVGVNGAGKSTMMNILGGLLQPDEGAEIIINGETVNIKNPKAAENLGIAFIQQEVAAFETMNVYENVLASDFDKWRIKGSPFLNKKAMKEEAKKLLATLDCHIDVDTPTHSLTVGEKQMVQIARALSQGGQILLFDEPTASLADTETQKLFEIINNLRSQGYIIFYISHYLDEIFEICDRVVALRDGQKTGEAPISEINKEKLVDMMIGHFLETAKRKDARDKADVILRAENITGVKFPKNISFDLHKGEILGVWGLLGSGRSELFNTLLGFDKMVEGKISFNQGGELEEISQKDFYKHVGYLTEGRHHNGVFLDMTIAENITSSDLERFASKGIGILNNKKEKEESRKYMKQVNVKAVDENMIVSKLSGGNQQKVIISKWMLKDPDILFMDEPTKGVDVGAKAEIQNLIFDRSEEGVSFVVVSSELEEIMNLCDRIIVIAEGKLVGEVNRDEFSKEALMAGIVKQEEKVEN
ncbi:MAG: sugar ABC transporter ATP-binding protein [Spirochaetales bacterium]|nr:sugar ABC transporter ATP-binding protein [Spirochaetales bacterium]